MLGVVIKLLWLTKSVFFPYWIDHRNTYTIIAHSGYLLTRGVKNYFSDAACDIDRYRYGPNTPNNA